MQTLLSKIDQKRHNIWRYSSFYPQIIEKKDQLEIENIFTPLEKYEDYYIKREDKNKTGSLKTRGIAYQLSIAKKNKYNNFVISTSGNAGITCSQYLEKYGGNLIVVTSEDVPDRKIDKLKKVCKHLIIAKNPTHVANYISKKYNFINLRASRDLNSIPGYYSLGIETYEQLMEDIDNIFIYSSSGSSFIGLFNSFQILKDLKCISKIPRMYATRRENVINFRHKEVLKICEETGGKEIVVTKEEFDYINFDTSHEGRASMFGLKKEAPKGLSVVYLTGRKYEDTVCKHSSNVIKINEFRDIDIYLKSNFLDQ